MNVRVCCPVCETYGPALSPVAKTWTCPACEHIAPVADPQPDPALHACGVCGTHELYKKKDFPHGLGMTILVAGFLVSTVFWFNYQITLAWAVLLGTAAFDTILYLLVKDVIVCYRCGSEYRGVEAQPHHLPHEQTTQEKYRQERLRKQDLERAARR